jgi:hypothetical protein
MKRHALLTQALLSLHGTRGGKVRRTSAWQALRGTPFRAAPSGKRFINATRRVSRRLLPIRVTLGALTYRARTRDAAPGSKQHAFHVTKNGPTKPRGGGCVTPIG